MCGKTYFKYKQSLFLYTQYILTERTLITENYSEQNGCHHCPPPHFCPQRIPPNSLIYNFPVTLLVIYRHIHAHISFLILLPFQLFQMKPQYFSLCITYVNSSMPYLLTIAASILYSYLLYFSATYPFVTIYFLLFVCLVHFARRANV